MSYYDNRSLSCFVACFAVYNSSSLLNNNCVPVDEESNIQYLVRTLLLGYE